MNSKIYSPLSIGALISIFLYRYCMMTDHSKLRSVALHGQNGDFLHIGIDTDKLISEGYVNEEYIKELIAELSTHSVFQMFLATYQARKCFGATDDFLRREMLVYEELLNEMEFFLGNEMQELITTLGYPTQPHLDIYAISMTLKELYDDLEYSLDYLEYVWHLLYKKMDKVNEVLIQLKNTPKALISSNKESSFYNEPVSFAYNQNDPFINVLASTHKPNDDCRDPVETIHLRSEKVMSVCAVIREVIRDIRNIKLDYYRLKCYFLSVYHHN